MVRTNIYYNVDKSVHLYIYAIYKVLGISTSFLSNLLYRKHREYAQCVTQRIKGRNNMIDHLTDNVISVQNLEQALDLYCKNQDRKYNTKL